MSGTTERQRVTVTYLAMEAPPESAPAPLPVGQRVAIVAATDPPPDYFLYLYEAVGTDWGWTDWLERSRTALEAFVGDPKVVVHTLLVDGWPGGFFMLDTREAGTCDIAYFGLVPQAIGRGLGRWFLGQAVATGWACSGVARLTVNTCTLDHPAALGLYQKLGFLPIRRELRLLPTETVAAPSSP